MNLDKATPELFTALAKAQGEIENATKASLNPHFKSKYADLAEVLNTIRAVLAKNGLSLIQSPAFDGAMVHVHSALCHSSGGYITSTSSCVPAKADGQGVGAATTYLRRYSAAALAGIAQEDDDGNAAAHTQPPAAETVEYQKYFRAIEDAPDSSALDDIGADLAKSKLSAGEKGKLRAAFATRKHALTRTAA